MGAKHGLIMREHVLQVYDYEIKEMFDKNSRIWY